MRKADIHAIDQIEYLGGQFVTDLACQASVRTTRKDFTQTENPGARPGFSSVSRSSTRPRPACGGSAGATCHCGATGGKCAAIRAAYAGVCVRGARGDA